MIRAVLADPDADLRKEAARCLGNIGTPARQAVPDLVNRLHDPDQNVCLYAALALWYVDRQTQNRSYRS